MISSALQYLVTKQKGRDYPPRQYEVLQEGGCKYEVLAEPDDLPPADNKD